MAQLPTWGPEREPVDVADAERVRAMPASERLRLLRALCRDAGRLLAAMDPEVRRRSLEYREPLPESSLRALSRLRSENKRKAH